MTNVAVIIPTFNAERTIGGLVKDVRRLGIPVFVVDDGSRDRTAPVATEAGALVISHLTNRGKGAALRSGFAVAMEQGYEAVVTMDSDGQHDPQEIPKLVEALKTSKAGLVIGNRMGDPSGMPAIRRQTNLFMSWIITTLAGQPIPDSQCGFRAIRRDALRGLPLTATRFEMESEILLQASKQGWRVLSVPVRSIYGDGRSHIRPLPDAMRFLGLIVQHLGDPLVHATRRSASCPDGV